MLSNYIKITLRTFWKSRLFSTLNIVGMGVGMAAVGLMVLYVVDELSYDRYNAKADRIYRVVQYADWSGGHMQLAPTSAPFADALKTEYPEIEKTVRFLPEGGGTITYKDTKIEAGDIFFADNSAFDIFTYPFLYGNPTTALTQPQSIVLTKTLAEKLFGDPSKAVGKAIEFENHFVNTVTGVIDDIPTNSHLRFSALRSMPANYTNGWQASELYTYVLLSAQSNQKALEAKFPQFFNKYLRKELGEGVKYRMELQPLTSIHLHSHLDYEAGPNGNSRTVTIFAIIATLILVIAIINYVNLYTVRSLSRLPEVGVRKAIGSQRKQLIGQFLTESALMALLASLVGLMLMKVFLPFFNELADKSLEINRYGWPATLLLFILGALLLGALSGAYPALMLSGFRPVVALKGQLGSQFRGRNFRQALVVFQFVAAVVLIAGSVVIYQQMRFFSQKNLGFNKEQVLTFHIDNEGVRQQTDALKTSLRESPLIEGVATASNPIGNNNIGTNGMIFEKAGVMPTETQVAQRFQVDQDYLNTLEINLLKGRNFSEKFPSDVTDAVLVNETLVKKLGWADPIGKRVRYFTGPQQMKEARVVGVVQDFHTYSLQHKIEPLVLQMPAPNDKDNVYVRIQPHKTTEALAYIRTAYKEFDPTAELDFHFLDQNFSQQYKAEQRQGQILLWFTFLAILIACLGLFGLAAFTAEQRTKEIGVRKVLGASVASIVALLSKDFLKLVLLAILIALPLAWYAMNEWLTSFAYRIDLAWWMFALAGLLAVFIALSTVAFQSIKAALMNPVKSLRTD
jgi:putative ABC transport system permease protein